MSDIPLRLHHVGEALVAALLREVYSNGRLSQLLCRTVTGEAKPLPDILNGAGVVGHLGFGDNISISEVCVDNVTYGVDGQSQIDCLATDGSAGLGIEVKLGTEGMTTATFTRRFLDYCTKSEHPTPRISGSMIALLDGRIDLPGADNVVMRATWKEEPLQIAHTWALLLRRKVWQNWKEGTTGPVLNNAVFIVFEDLVDVVGGMEVFDRIVSGLVGSSFAKPWGLV